MSDAAPPPLPDLPATAYSRKNAVSFDRFVRMRPTEQEVRRR